MHFQMNLDMICVSMQYAPIELSAASNNTRRLLSPFLDPDIFPHIKKKKRN